MKVSSSTTLDLVAFNGFNVMSLGYVILLNVLPLPVSKGQEKKYIQNPKIDSVTVLMSAKLMLRLN